jgi:hypothetical protein
MKTPTLTQYPKDLRREPPRSPRVRIGGYAILARAADKGRATIHELAGEYHYNCPVDQMLFHFKGVTGEDFLAQLEAGATDEELAAWLDLNGTPKTIAEIKEWSDSIETTRPYDDPERRDWFIEQCTKLGLKPKTATLFEYLEADDRDTFPG